MSWLLAVLVIWLSVNIVTPIYLYWRRRHLMARWTDADPTCKIQRRSRVLVPDSSDRRVARVIATLGSRALITYPTGLPFVARVADMRLVGRS